MGYPWRSVSDLRVLITELLQSSAGTRPPRSLALALLSAKVTIAAHSQLLSSVSLCYPRELSADYKMHSSPIR